MGVFGPGSLEPSRPPSFRLVSPQWYHARWRPGDGFRRTVPMAWWPAATIEAAYPIWPDGRGPPADRDHSGPGPIRGFFLLSTTASAAKEESKKVNQELKGKKKSLKTKTVIWKVKFLVLRILGLLHLALRFCIKSWP